jgi:hypothetical protein
VRRIHAHAGACKAVAAQSLEDALHEQQKTIAICHGVQLQNKKNSS